MANGNGTQSAAVRAVPAAEHIRLKPTDQRKLTAAVDKLRFNQPWGYYDSVLIDDLNTMPQTLNFWQNTRAKGLAITNLVQPGQIPEPFRCYGIAVELKISCYDDPRIFELLANYSAIEIKVGSDEMIVGPVSQFPAGGGMTGDIEPMAMQAGLFDPSLPITGPGGGPEPGGGGPTTASTRRRPHEGVAATLPGGEHPPPILMAQAGAILLYPNNVLTNGAPMRSNIYSFASDPIKVKKGANITTDLHIERGAFDALRARGAAGVVPKKPGVLVRIRLEGRRARAAGYGMGG